MTSGSFAVRAIDSIIIDRAERQRRELKKLDELAASIAAVGLINPPVITREGRLIAGERRLEACRQLGWLELPVQFAEDMDPLQLHLIELEENVKRLDLTWQEHNDAIARYHELKREQDPSWKQTDTAESLGLSSGAVTQHLAVAKARSDAVPGLDTADKFSTALGIANRRAERVRNAILTQAAPLEEAPPEEGPARRASIIHANFNEWAKTASHQFNLIHCDFPYGVNTGDKIGQSAAKGFGTYADGEDVYWELIQTFTTRADNFIAPAAHLIFWFSMKFYTPTVEALTQAGWRVDPFPFIWHRSDDKGIIPDPQRGPRRTYETALFASRGDRKIVRPVSNSIAAATTKTFHQAEKPAAVLEHFFRMLVDDTTDLLDPTAGSGMAVKVAEELGARTALGLEQLPEFVEAARINCGL
jgi:ParB/RepB/Spo0J family partition protein